MHEGEFERKGCGNMKRYKVVFLFAMVASWMMIGEANDAVQTAAKTALRDVNGTSLGKLYKVRKQAETAERQEMIVQACVAGLYAIGDVKNARKISEGLDCDEFLRSLTDECCECNGEGRSRRSCYKCRGSGACQNRKCNGGVVNVEGFRGSRINENRERACPICKGSGRCASCNGDGEVMVSCRKCNGSRRIVKMEQARTSCRELLKTLASYKMGTSIIDDGLNDLLDMAPMERKGTEHVDRVEEYKKETLERETQLKAEIEKLEKASLAREARLKAERERLERESLAREAQLKAEREEREKRIKEEKQRKDQEKMERERQILKELDEQKRELARLPKSVNSWKRDIGRENQVFVESSFSTDLFLPIQARVWAKGGCLWSQVNRKGEKTCIVFQNGTRCDDLKDNTRVANRAYLALFAAAQKAKVWMRTAVERGEDNFIKEISVSNALECCSVVLAKNDDYFYYENKGNVRFWFEVQKLDEKTVRKRRDRGVGMWFRSLTKDMNHAYCLKIENSGNAIYVDLDSIDEFLKIANPVGAIEALEKFENLYK